MNEEFELTINNEGREESFKAILKPFGYSYNIEVEVLQGLKIIYEPDETIQNYRAIVSNQDFLNELSIDKEQIKLIALELQKLFL